ncbi:MAG: hypothetical protein Kow0068_06900 [Marinilabiliales bacterium]
MCPSDKKNKILIVEDDDFNYALFAELLSVKNFNLLRASDGDEAIAVFKTNPDINLVLLDIKMPKKDGYEVFKEMKKINPNIPVIAQTAYALTEDIEKIKKTGFNDFITKPLEISNLYNTINKFIPNSAI